MKIILKKFDISKINKYSTILIIGLRHNGKTTLIKELVNNNKEINKKCIISPDNYEDLRNEQTYICEKYVPKIIETVYEQQVKLYNLKNREILAESSAYLILENSIFNTEIFKDKNFKNILLNGKHLNISLILAIQFPMKLPPLVRSNLDYTFVFKDNNILNRKELYEKYGGFIEDFQFFSKIMDSLKDYECIVIDHTIHNSDSVIDLISYYKVDIENNLPEITEGLLLSKL
jgi:hypothetical protein